MRDVGVAPVVIGGGWWLTKILNKKENYKRNAVPFYPPFDGQTMHYELAGATLLQLENLKGL